MCKWLFMCCRCKVEGVASNIMILYCYCDITVTIDCQ